MPGFAEGFLNQEIAGFDEQVKILACKHKQLADTDCAFGACIHDERMLDLESRIEETQVRKKALEEAHQVPRLYGGF